MLFQASKMFASNAGAYPSVVRPSPGPRVLKLFTDVFNEFSEYGSVFFSAKLSLPSIMFRVKPRLTWMNCTFQVLRS